MAISSTVSKGRMSSSLLEFNWELLRVVACLNLSVKLTRVSLLKIVNAKTRTKKKNPKTIFMARKILFFLLDSLLSSAVGRSLSFGYLSLESLPMLCLSSSSSLYRSH